MQIKIKYHDTELERCKVIEQGNWIDLRAAETVYMKKGEFKIINLGISIKIRSDYEAYIVPRSSTYKRYGVIQANGIGIIDSSYCGNNDILGFPCIALRDTVIKKNDRICQMRVQKAMGNVQLYETEIMTDENRGGFGSTGVR